MVAAGFHQSVLHDIPFLLNTKRYSLCLFIIYFSLSSLRPLFECQTTHVSNGKWNRPGKLINPFLHLIFSAGRRSTVWSKRCTKLHFMPHKEHSLLPSEMFCSYRSVKEAMFMCTNHGKINMLCVQNTQFLKVTTGGTYSTPLGS